MTQEEETTDLGDAALVGLVHGVDILDHRLEAAVVLRCIQEDPTVNRARKANRTCNTLAFLIQVVYTGVVIPFQAFQGWYPNT